jgi:sugar lactone lactonase YvrE
MSWVTLFFASLRSGFYRGPAERIRRGRPAVGCPRTQRPVLELLEDRLSPSVDLLVGNTDNSSVLRYNGLTGAFLGAFVSDGYGGLVGPHGFAFTPDGKLLVADATSSSVLRYDNVTGAFLGAFVPSGSGGLDGAPGIVYGPDGNLYVSSAYNREVLRYNGTTGLFMGIFVTSYSGGLDRPHGLTFGPDGNLYVNSSDNNSVMRYQGPFGDQPGAPLPAPSQSGAVFVPSGSGGLNSPYGGLVFGSDNNLYVSSYGSSSVLRYDGTTGDLIDAFVPQGSGGLSGSHGLSFGPDGNLYVVSQATNSVLDYDGTTGTFLGVFVPPVQLSTPTSLVFWDTGMQGPSGSGGAPGHQFTASAAHAAGLADAAVLVGLVGISGQPHDGNALGSAALSSASRPANVVTPALAVWTATASPAAAAIPDGQVNAVATVQDGGALVPWHATEGAWADESFMTDFDMNSISGGLYP